MALLTARDACSSSGSPSPLSLRPWRWSNKQDIAADVTAVCWLSIYDGMLVAVTSHILLTSLSLAAVAAYHPVGGSVYLPLLQSPSRWRLDDLMLLLASPWRHRLTPPNVRRSFRRTAPLGHRKLERRHQAGREKNTHHQQSQELVVARVFHRHHITMSMEFSRRRKYTASSRRK